MDLPAYWFSAGLMSKLSTWLTPPQRKIQITDFAFGGRTGFPAAGVAFFGCASATPSRNSMEPSTRPVKPMPVSARKERRVTPGQPLFVRPSFGDRIVLSASLPITALRCQASRPLQLLHHLLADRH